MKIGRYIAGFFTPCDAIQPNIIMVQFPEWVDIDYKGVLKIWNLANHMQK